MYILPVLYIELLLGIVTHTSMLMQICGAKIVFSNSYVINSITAIDYN